MNNQDQKEQLNNGGQQTQKVQHENGSQNNGAHISGQNQDMGSANPKTSQEQNQNGSQNQDQAIRQTNHQNGENGLQEEINKLKERCAELENNWKRALADYKNLERRVAEEKDEFLQLANMVLLQRLLPVMDNLELLEKHIDDTGLKMVVKEFRQILNDAGVKPIESDGKDFESESMECLEITECEEEKNNKVLETLRKGYQFKNKILRPAQVRVGKVKS